jgi:hypothetical protein
LGTTIPTSRMSIWRFGRTVGAPRTRQGRLRVGVETHRNGLAEMDPENLGRLRGHDRLIRTFWIGHTPLDDRHAVLVEVEAVHAADRVGEGRDLKLDRRPAGRQERGVESEAALSTRSTPRRRANWRVVSVR